MYNMHLYSGVRDLHDKDMHYLVFGDLFCPCKASYQTLQIRVVYSLSLGLLHMCINGGFGLKNTTELSVKKTFTKHTNQSHFALRGFHFTDSMLVHAALEVAQTNFWNH